MGKSLGKIFQRWWRNKTVKTVNQNKDKRWLREQNKKRKWECLGLIQKENRDENVTKPLVSVYLREENVLRQGY